MGTKGKRQQDAHRKWDIYISYICLPRGQEKCKGWGQWMATRKQCFQNTAWKLGLFAQQLLQHAQNLCKLKTDKTINMERANGHKVPPIVFRITSTMNARLCKLHIRPDFPQRDVSVYILYLFFIMNYISLSFRQHYHLSKFFLQILFSPLLNPICLEISYIVF